jgi:hypothetical protein
VRAGKLIGNFLSEVAREGLDGANPAAAGPLAEITSISLEVMDSMSDMVWVINPGFGGP